MGSPLIQFVSSRAVVIGILSRTDVYCEPTVQYFTRVSHFIDWVQSIIEGKSESKETVTSGLLQSGTNEEMKVVLIIDSIFVTLFVIAICSMIIVIIINSRSNQIYYLTFIFFI
jgi:hypothetical protein